ncbi:MAG: hypothetical protein HY651_11075 [Acidobacteria bacterium]|nr:hypothetical protein [Acidobacteriota bacterium]
MKPANVWKVAIVGTLLLAALGCQRLMNQDAAVQKAIQDHLSERSDLAMDKMVMEMQQVKVDGDKAQAEVVFHVAGDSQMRMAYHYDLHREGASWKVDSGRPSGSETPHPQMGESPAGESMPGESGNGEPSLDLPEGHPPIGEMNPPGEEAPPSSQP